MSTQNENTQVKSENAQEKTYFLPSEAYNVMKWLALIACPALATFYGVCAPLWGWPAPQATVTTINAVGVLLGALIGYSAMTATTVSQGGAGADEKSE